MRKILAILLALALALSLMTVAWATGGEATTIYVDAKTTVEESKGTEDAPYKTIHEALAGLTDGSGSVTIVVAPGEYDETMADPDKPEHYGSGLIISGNVTIQAKDPNNRPVIYAFANCGTEGTGAKISGQATIFISGENVELKDLIIMPCGGYDANNYGYNKTVGVSSSAGIFTMTGCETKANDKQKEGLGAHSMAGKGAGWVHVSSDGSSISGNTFGAGTYVASGWKNNTPTDFYSVSVSGNTWTDTNIADHTDGYVTDGDTIYVNHPAALNKAINDGENKTVVLGADITVSVPEGTGVGNGAINLTKSITIDGNGHTITAQKDNGGFAANSGSIRGEYHVIGITGGRVTLKNLTVNGNGVARSGINVWTDGKDGKTVEAVLTDVTSQNNTTYGVTAMGNSVTLNNVTTSGNKWGGVNADTRGSAATSLTVNGGSFGEKNSLYVEKDSTATGFVKVEIKGGTFTGAVSVAKEGGKDVENTSLSISGGQFTSADDTVRAEIKKHLASGLTLNASGTVRKSGGGSSRPAEDDTVTSADTFDAGVALYAGMALTSALGAAYVTGKRR